MGVVLLDTDVYSFLAKPDKKKAEIYKQHVEGATLALTFVTIGEIYAGAAKAKWATDKIEALEQNLKMFVTRIFNLMFDMPTFQRLSASLFIGARAR